VGEGEGESEGRLSDVVRGGPWLAGTEYGLKILRIWPVPIRRKKVREPRFRSSALFTPKLHTTAPNDAAPRRP
jgi:hypothetical protein